MATILATTPTTETSNATISAQQDEQLQQQQQQTTTATTTITSLLRHDRNKAMIKKRPSFVMTDEDEDEYHNDDDADIAVENKKVEKLHKQNEFRRPPSSIGTSLSSSSPPDDEDPGEDDKEESDRNSIQQKDSTNQLPLAKNGQQDIPTVPSSSCEEHHHIRKKSKSSVEMNDEDNDDANDSDNDDNDDDDLPQTEQQKGKQDNIDEDSEQEFDKPQAADADEVVAEDDQSNDDVEIEDKNNDFNAGNDNEGNANDDDDDDEYNEEEDDDDDSQEGGFDIRLDDMDEEQREHIMRLITAAADGNPDMEGLPPSLILRAIMQQQGLRRGEYDDDDATDDGPIEYPFGPHLPNSLQEVAEFILSDQCRNILVLAGAGMSVSAGIPDFRSADGLYATLNPDLLTATDDEKEMIRDDPTVSLEKNMFLRNPFPLLELQREFILGTYEQKWKATIAHRFVEMLHTKTNKLVRVYTQNIDGLEDQCTMLPHDKVIAVHGSMDRAVCERCDHEMNYPSFCEQVKTKIKDLSRHDKNAPTDSTPIRCDNCGYDSMKPSIVLFRSGLPKIFFESVPKDIVNDIDLLIVMGTSLRVAPANSIVWRVPKTCMRLLVNRECVGQHLGMKFPTHPNHHDDDNDSSDDEESESSQQKYRDYFASGNCDEVLLELMKHLGWVDELKSYYDTKQLPDACIKLLKERRIFDHEDHTT